jgi:multiple sugar transport system substrate-binding protein
MTRFPGRGTTSRWADTGRGTRRGGFLRHRRTGAAALTLSLAAALAACSSTSAGDATASTPPASAATDKTPVTITLWSGFTDRELGVLGQAVAQFEKGHPWITVKNVGAQDDDKIVKAIRAGNAPDVALSFTADRIGSYCGSKAWIDLAPYIARDKVDLSAIPKVSLDYTQFNGVRCAMPALADTYGLYYNTAMLKAAGYSNPPKTASELLDMAVKLTTYNSDGSIKVAGFVPLWGFYEMAPAHVAPLWGAPWTDSAGKSAFTDPAWSSLLQWQKKFVDAIGYDKLRRFTSGAGDSEFAATNLFETGKLAMNLDGEYRTAFIHSEHPDLQFNTAPFPSADDQANRFGAGYVTGNSLGIPRTSTGHNREAAWQLVKYLSTDPAAQTLLAQKLKNVPTLTASLSDPSLTKDPQFATFLRIYANPQTATTPPSAAGSADQDTLSALAEKYQAGSVGDLNAALAAANQQVDAQVAQAGGGGAP